MGTFDAKAIGTTLALDIFERKLRGGVVVLAADAAEAAQLHEAALSRWQKILSAYSSGIAHADDPYDPKIEKQEAELRELQRADFVAPDGTAKANAPLVVEFVVGAASDAPTVYTREASAALPPRR